VFRLVASDVGRPLGDIKSNIEGEDFLDDAQAVLDSLVPREKEVQTSGHAWYLAQIMPYRTLANVIEGVVLTFTDITGLKEIEEAVRGARDYAENIVDTVRQPLIVMDGDLKVVSANESFYRIFKISSQETIGSFIYDLGNRQWDIPRLRELLENVLPHETKFENVEVEHDFPAIGRRRMMLNARRIVGKTGETKLILLAMEDVAIRDRAEGKIA